MVEKVIEGLKVYRLWDKSNEEHARKRIRKIVDASYEMYLLGIIEKNEIDKITDFAINLYVEYDLRNEYHD